MNAIKYVSDVTVFCSDLFKRKVEESLRFLFGIQKKMRRILVLEPDCKLYEVGGVSSMKMIHSEFKCACKFFGSLYPVNGVFSLTDVEYILYLQRNGSHVWDYNIKCWLKNIFTKLPLNELLTLDLE